MNTKHTPGPWRINQYDEPVDASGENIRAKGLALTNTDEAKANTRLIAAAPELLAALKAWADNPDGWSVDQVNAAQVIIRQAEGQS